MNPSSNLRKIPMKEYRKKPVTVQALQWTGENDDEVADFMSYPVFKNPEGHLGVRTLEGLVYTAPGSFIVKGQHGDVWPVREDIFLDTYEEASEPETIQEWLQKLPPGYRERALANADRVARPASSIAHAVDEAFVWDWSPEGDSFWSRVYSHFVLMDTPLPPLP